MTMKRVINQEGKYSLVDTAPVYEQNYYKGYIGFCYDLKSWVSWCIAKLTKYCCYSNISVSHALIVIDENTCVEADFKSGSVVKSYLSKYFDDNKKTISFRKPRDLNEEIANEIVQYAEAMVGKKYETLEILGHLFKAGYFTRKFNRLTNYKYADKISNFLDNKNKFVCSELATECLKNAKTWAYCDQGILSRKSSRLNPQELFEDRKIFKEWDIESVS